MTPHHARPPILLVVEDELPIVELLATLSAPLGVEVLAAPDARQALAMLETVQPSLMLIDLVLPDLDGFALLERIRGRRELEEMPVLVVSALADPTSMRRAYALGANDYVTKPFNTGIVEAKLSMYLRMTRLTEELRERQRLLEDVVEQLSSGLLVCDAAGDVLHINPAGAAALGLDDTLAAMGRRLGEVAPGAEAMVQAQVGAQQRRMTVLTMSGERQLGYTTARLSDGGTVAVFRELSEAETARRETEERQRLAALARSARGFAHEVRNPIAAIAAAAQVIARDDANRAVVQRLARAVEGEARRLAGLLAEYVESQVPAPPSGEADLAAMLAEVMEVNLLALPARERVRLECADELPLVRGDGARLKQVVLNLVLNAMAATEAGGEVLLSAIHDVEGGGVRLTVRDTGVGIPPALMPRIFEENFSTRPGGHGLGLPIARRIVEAHGGRIRVESAAGSTCFAVFLPAVSR